MIIDRAGIAATYPRIQLSLRRTPVLELEPRDLGVACGSLALKLEPRIAAEPSGAAALSALSSGAYHPARDERVAVRVCGGNTDAVSL